MFLSLASLSYRHRWELEDGEESPTRIAVKDLAGCFPYTVFRLGS